MEKLEELKYFIELEIEAWMKFHEETEKSFSSNRFLTFINQRIDWFFDTHVLGKEVNTMLDTFRKEYTPLDEEQKEKVAEIKNKAQELLDLFDSTVTREERSDRSRCMAVARTNLETTIMWAIKGVTSEKVNTSFDNKPTT